jgi:hypothetical protein
LFPPYQSSVLNRWTTGLFLCTHRMREVGREVLESSSADFQSAANPSQLPTHDLFGAYGSGQEPIVNSILRAIWLLVPDPFSPSQNEKSPMSQRHRALEVFSEYGQASQAQNLSGERRFILETGRQIGITACTQGSAYET